MAIREPKLKPLVLAKRKFVADGRTKQPPRIVKPKIPTTTVIKPIPEK